MPTGCGCSDMNDPVAVELSLGIGGVGPYGAASGRGAPLHRLHLGREGLLRLVATVRFTFMIRFIESREPPHHPQLCAQPALGSTIIAGFWSERLSRKEDQSAGASQFRFRGWWSNGFVRTLPSPSSLYRRFGTSERSPPDFNSRRSTSSGWWVSYPCITMSTWRYSISSLLGMWLTGSGCRRALPATPRSFETTSRHSRVRSSAC